MRRLQGPSLDALYAGRCTLSELDEYEATQWLLPLAGDRVADPDDAYADEPLTPLTFLGKPRKWRDVRCRCDRPLPFIDYYGPDDPLEKWCFHCGRVMERPYDAKFFPIHEEDRRHWPATVPTAEVGIIAEPVS